VHARHVRANPSAVLAELLNPIDESFFPQALQVFPAGM
jgi:hypothetical protein